MIIWGNFLKWLYLKIPGADPSLNWMIVLNVVTITIQQCPEMTGKVRVVQDGRFIAMSNLRKKLIWILVKDENLQFIRWVRNQSVFFPHFCRYLHWISNTSLKELTSRKYKFLLLLLRLNYKALKVQNPQQ